VVSEPRLMVWESYLEKANEFFAWAGKRGLKELSALIEGKEEGDDIVLTDILLPKKDRILIHTRKEHEYYILHQDACGQLEKDYELLCCDTACCLTPSYGKRILSSPSADSIKGWAHNHSAGDPEKPSLGDFLALVDFLRFFDHRQKYLVSVIYFGNEFETFHFPKEDIYFLRQMEKERGSYVAQHYAAGWFERNKETIALHRYEVIKGK
jgi:hypothetical protein